MAITSLDHLTPAILRLVDDGISTEDIIAGLVERWPHKEAVAAVVAALRTRVEAIVVDGEILDITYGSGEIPKN